MARWGRAAGRRERHSTRGIDAAVWFHNRSVRGDEPCRGNGTNGQKRQCFRRSGRQRAAPKPMGVLWSW